jgi:16S rRNA (adenine1518-N6/adenine1519-N6)-dimethyltransferase
MSTVKPKKYLGQHFLKDENIAQKISESLSDKNINLLEIGPGTGVLTKYLINKHNLKLIEIDYESVEYLNQKYPDLKENIFHYDFLKFPVETAFNGEKYSIIGNFPYNISTQILFKIFENRNSIIEVVGMFQKEVADRIASKHGNKTYGILSVLLQAYFDIEYLFTVEQDAFFPPPKVKSAVIKLKRNGVEKIDCNEKDFISIVKTAFNQRRKTLRNSLKSYNFNPELIKQNVLQLRAEQLSIDDFIELTNCISKV